jgi:uncharacterized iron-regulated membrane protein
VLSLTGALAVFIPEIDAFIQKRYYRVSSCPAAAPSFGRSLEQVTRAHPDHGLLMIELPDQPDQAAAIHASVKDPLTQKAARHSFFVDTGRDVVLGSRNHANSLANYLRQMHVRLYEGTWGRQLVGLGGIALVVVAVTGLLIYGDFMKRQPYPSIRKGRGLRILMADWHKILGISALLFNLVIGLTGAWLGLQPKIVQWFGLHAPSHFKPPVVMEAGADKNTTIAWPAALQAVRQQFPDLEVKTVMPSADGSGTIAFRGNIRGQAYERNANSLILSKKELKPVYKYDVRTQSVGHKFYYIQEALHFGDFGGLALKILYALLGLSSGFLSISGFVVFISRTGKKAQRKHSPLKAIFLYTSGIVLVLVLAALVSLFIGYSQAAFMMAVLLNAGLAGWVAYLVLHYLVQKRKKPALA